MLKRTTLALIAFAVVGAHAQTKSAAMGEIELKAACETIRTTVTEAMNDIKDEATKKAALESATKKLNACALELRQAYKAVRKLGSEYVILGVGYTYGGDLNLPKVRKVGPGVRFSTGVSVFGNVDKDTMMPGVSATPTISLNAFGESAAYKKNAVEPQSGFIYYVGILGNKEINDFNGLYVGGGAEWVKPGQSELNNKEYKVFNAYINPVNGSIIITYITSENGGKGEVGKNGQVHAMYITNYSLAGSGATPMDVLRMISSQTLDLGEGILTALTTAAEIGKQAAVDSFEELSAKIKKKFN